ncbi:hypothetical protein MNBD_BACTEROID05-783 [hydrothermal vent metagenome]|uniref:YfdX protein n=1 Tax=hydrothermal vent metagenome TaxID=652676 RepID=A0A3B0T405_9ZZZZ
MKLLRVFILLSMFTVGAISSVVQAQNQQTSKNDKVIKAVEKKKTQELDEESDKVVREALDGVILTKKAYQLLDQDKSSKAKEIIIQSLSKIDAAIEANQDVILLPIEADVQVLMGVYDLSTAIGRKEAALESLNLGNLQAARALLTPMVDEIDVEVVSIPIIAYKRKLNDALGYLENSKKWEARQSLKEALSLFILTKEVLPIPLVEAEALIDEAVITETTDKQKAVELLEQANDALSLVAVLGYTTKEDKELWDQLRKENKKLSKFKHRQMKKNMSKKINALGDKIKDGTSEVHKKMTDQINKIKEKLSFKK